MPEMTPMIRPSAIAGRWYPGSPAALRSDVQRYFEAVPQAALPGRILGLIAPHAGYAYSGPIAARAFAQVQGAGFARVVLLGPLHRPIWGSPVGPYMVASEAAYSTPLGQTPLDAAFIEQLGRRVPLTRVQGDEEHSLEIELPFLQVALGGSFTLVPIMLGEHIGSSRATERVSALARALAELIDDRTLLVCSTDLSHMENYADVVATDRRLVEFVSRFDVEGLRTELKNETVQACGAVGLLAVLETCQMLGATAAQVLQYTNSGEVTGDKRPGTYTVGYLAAAIYACLTREQTSEVSQTSEVWPPDFLMLYADVCVNTPTGAPSPAAPTASDDPGRETFTYAVPAGLAGRLQPGHLAWIPFRSRRVQGVVMRVHDAAPDFQTRELLALVWAQPVLTPAQLGTRRMDQPRDPGAADRIAAPHAARGPVTARPHRVRPHIKPRAGRPFREAGGTAGAHR